MKKKSTKKAFEKFKKRNTHKRRTKEAARRELMRAVAETGVGTDALHLGDSHDGGRRERASSKRRHDERSAEGVFSSSRSGFGFVTVEDREGDVFIPQDKTAGALDGDVVEIVFHEYEGYLGERKTEGRVTKILVETRKKVIGRVEEERMLSRRRARLPHSFVLVPDDPKMGDSIRIKSSGVDVRVGDKVEATLIRPRSGSRLECEVVRSFGRFDTREANYESILAECEIPVDFTPEELAEAQRLAATPLTEEGRVRRREIIFTIDGEGAKDLDDAISLRKIKGGWQLGVHIADVSAYVGERTHLDRAVMARGTSVYFTDKVVPMLPPALSNGACSLNAGEDKYTLSAIINLDSAAEIKSVRIEPSIIRSRVRGVYSEVNAIFENRADNATRVKYKEVIPTLKRMHELYLVLKEKSRARGSLELESAEAEIVLDKDGMPVDIVRRTRADAEMMIEEFMLTANEAVARLLSDKDIPCVYRVHDEPPPEKLFDFVAYVHSLGFDTDFVSVEKATSADFCRLLTEAEERGLLPQVSYSMLRSMSKAKYSDVRRAHFGLSLSYYCHFTSPIRRLSDLATHRIIHKVLLEGKRADAYRKYARRAAAAATESELRAVDAERKIENLYKVIFMKDRIGEQFDAVINSITSFGFFAELENTCEGLVPISELDGMFAFDEKNITLRSFHKIYHIADRVRVRLEEADIVRGKLRFSVVE
ncbi:MAG: VacB/RNase II family 3'-5' exoribonuclease [Clostridia bacterium]|nr:VacB/RNase II family 3'-5' exoribonuclease [Clostridia bacterium]